jgi:hypothetical protein
MSTHCFDLEILCSKMAPLMNLHCGNLLKAKRGEVAEWFKALVC